MGFPNIPDNEVVDEAALTYAEVKALATGNSYIKEKMDFDIQVSKLKLMKANHTSQKYRFEDNIAKHYPQQITILKERISGMQADIQTAKVNLPMDKEQFSMKVGDKLFTDKKEAGTALVEMCKEIKTINATAVIGEYAGFKMAVSFDAFNHKFVMNLKGQMSRKLQRTKKRSQTVRRRIFRLQRKQWVQGRIRASYSMQMHLQKECP